MKNRLLTILAAFMLIVPAVRALGTDVKSYEIKVGEFMELKVVNGIRVEYRASEDSCGYAVFRATSDMASVIMASVEKNCLTLQLSTDGVSARNIPTVTVYSRFLQIVENEGDSLVKVVNPNAVPVFKAKVVGNGQISVHGLTANSVDASLTTGNGTILITGSATQAKYSLVGTGSIQCADLKAYDVKCKLLGTGYVECWPTNKLSVIGASSGKVYYRGKVPEIKNNSIGVKVLEIQE